MPAEELQKLEQLVTAHPPSSASSTDCNSDSCQALKYRLRPRNSRRVLEVAEKLLQERALGNHAVSHTDAPPAAMQGIPQFFAADAVRLVRLAEQGIAVVRVKVPELLLVEGADLLLPFRSTRAKDHLLADPGIAFIKPGRSFIGSQSRKSAGLQLNCRIEKDSGRYNTTRVRFSSRSAYAYGNGVS